MTDAQFLKFKQLAFLMDSGSISPIECARRARAHGISVRYTSVLTGLTYVTINGIR